MKIAAFEPFYTGSHQQWLDGLVRFSSHEIRTFTLPGRHWKWRMHGGAISLAERFLESAYQPDLILCTDMVDVNVLLSLIRRRVGDVPVVLYMHENQLTYPWSESDPDVALKRDNHYAFINYASVCAADAVAFNSPYHKDSFLSSLKSFLRQFPDHQNLGTIRSIAEKCEVLPLGMDLQRIEAREKDRSEQRRPTLLWNHRWEYDKGPNEFFRLIERLDEDGVSFELIICGEQSSKVPDVFVKAKKRYQSRIRHYGYAADAAHYLELLAAADVLPVTSIQDFFGVSIVEAMYSGVQPVLPRRLTYEWLAQRTTGAIMYDTDQELFEVTKGLLETSVSDFDGSRLKEFDWRNLIRQYDEYFTSL